MKQLTWLGIILSLALTVASSESVDRTKTEKATGSNVVQAVVDKIGQTCIFPNDRQFIRRMAYVESQDGKDTFTFRPSFNGGIWQVSKRLVGWLNSTFLGLLKAKFIFKATIFQITSNHYYYNFTLLRVFHTSIC